jgi:hypothetical protein
MTNTFDLWTPIISQEVSKVLAHCLQQEVSTAWLDFDLGHLSDDQKSGI